MTGAIKGLGAISAIGGMIALCVGLTGSHVSGAQTAGLGGVALIVGVLMFAAGRIIDEIFGNRGRE